MSHSYSTPSLPDMLSVTAMSSMSLLDETQMTPTPKNKKTLSESSLSTMTPPDSNRGAMTQGEGPGRKFTALADQMFIKSDVEDDVFGRSAPATPVSKANLNSTSAIAAAKVQANLATPISLKQTPRLDRMNSPITPANAQGVLPPEACVFVANLSTLRTDDQLEVSCHEHFDVFGRCHIKVRRDHSRHPFAIVQYYRKEDADNAINESHDVMIDGRNIRTEFSEAHRTVALTKVGGGTITADEAIETLQAFGPVTPLYPTTHSDARNFGIPEGLWVEFAFYLDYKDALKSFNHTTTEYRIHKKPKFSTRTYVTPHDSPTDQGFTTSRSTTDQKSIFVGNLPADTTEQCLKQLFGECGIIRAVNIIRKHIQGGVGYNVFGFIEFNTVSEAEMAASLEVEIKGEPIRVEPKEYSARRHSRLGQYSPVMSPVWRNPRYPYRQNYNYPHMDMGISMVCNTPFYTMQSPTHHSTAGYNRHVYNSAEASPYDQAGGFHQIYNTPPPSVRMARRNEMFFSGSPHHMSHWTQFNGAANQNYPGGMIQIPEEVEY